MCLYLTEGPLCPKLEFLRLCLLLTHLNWGRIKKINPRRKPEKNPPIWAKLSTCGRIPTAKLITTMTIRVNKAANCKIIQTWNAEEIKCQLYKDNGLLFIRKHALLNRTHLYNHSPCWHILSNLSTALIACPLVNQIMHQKHQQRCLLVWTEQTANSLQNQISHTEIQS